MAKQKTYSNFKYEDLKNLGLFFESKKLFEFVKNIEPSEWLNQTLNFYSDIPKGTEKAKSEMIIVPILAELKKNNPNVFKFFSGYNFDVDKENGLKGHCDFLLTLKYNSPIIDSPVFSVVEAKKSDYDLGIPQCVAEMYAARLFNVRNGSDLNIIFGAVTIGTSWLFLKLENNTIYQDIKEYELSDLPQLLGVLQKIIDFYKK
jgi:hypothetical protein